METANLNLEMSSSVSSPPVLLTLTPSFTCHTPYVRLTSGPLLSRLLYASPACLLTSVTSTMAITWLTCCGNAGAVLLCVDKRRRTQGGMEVGGKVVLSAGGTDETTLRAAGTRVGLGEGGKKERLRECGRETFSLFEEEAPGIEAPLGSWAAVIRLEKRLDEEGDCVVWKGLMVEGYVRGDEWDGKRWLGGGLVFRGAGEFAAFPAKCGTDVKKAYI